MANDMSENDFYDIKGNQYRGSRYGNFVGGGTDAQGNVSSGVTENSYNNSGTSQDTSQINGQPSDSSSYTPASDNSTQIPTIGDSVKGLAKAGAGAALGAAGTYIGQTAGYAVGQGAGIGEGISQGVSSLANKVSGGLIGSAPSSVSASAVANQTGNIGASSLNDAAQGVTQEASGSFGSAANIGAAAGAGIASAAATLLTGGGVKQAVKSGVGTAVGTAIGNAVLPGIGGFVGGAIGGAIGGRVICTQLVVDGLLDKSDQRLDMEFTFKALSNVHVRGYLYWGRPWVKKMRENPVLRDRTHKVVVWRLNEIKYQLGLRDKPDYRGRIVRLIGENLCFIIGLFLSDTKESIIYKKETSYVSAR